MLIKVDLDSKALSYIVGELRQGGALAEAVLKSTPLNQGRFFTYLPNNINISEINDFGESIAYLSGSHILYSATKIIETMITEYCLEAAQNIAIFETLWSVPVPSSRNSPGIKYFALKGSKYDYITEDFARLVSIDHYISDAQGYPTIIVLTTQPPGLVITPYQEVSEDFINAFAENTTRVVVGAYDGEGYMIWDRYGK